MDGESTATQPARVDVTFEELEAQIAADKAAGDKPKLGDIKIDGEGVPDELKGKSVAEILTMQKGLSDSLRISEERRVALERAAATAVPVAPVAPPEEKEERELTRDELAELHKNDPLAAIDYMQARAAKVAQKNLDKRLGTLVAGGASGAEQAARARYPDEFQLFGDEINVALKTIVNPDAMTQAKAWDDLVAWIRGKSGNIDKLFDFRVEKAKKGKQTDAQAAQAASAGATVRPVTVGAGAAGSGEAMDDTMKEIARTLFPGLAPDAAYAEYNKWRRVS